LSKDGSATFMHARRGMADAYLLLLLLLLMLLLRLLLLLLLLLMIHAA
jgi:hypothetical protein